MKHWLPIKDMPAEGEFLVKLEKQFGQSKYHVMVKHPNVSFIGGAFSFDAPKPTHFMYIPEDD